MTMKCKLLGILVLAAVAIQFVPYGKEHSNPTVIAEPDWDSPMTRECFLHPVLIVTAMKRFGRDTAKLLQFLG